MDSPEPWDAVYALVGVIFFVGLVLLVVFNCGSMAHGTPRRRDNNRDNNDNGSSCGSDVIDRKTKKKKWSSRKSQRMVDIMELPAVTIVITPPTPALSPRINPEDMDSIGSSSDLRQKSDTNSTSNNNNNDATTTTTKTTATTATTTKTLRYGTASSCSSHPSDVSSVSYDDATVLNVTDDEEDDEQQSVTSSCMSLADIRGYVTPPPMKAKRKVRLLMDQGTYASDEDEEEEEDEEEDEDDDDESEDSFLVTKSRPRLSSMEPGQSKADFRIAVKPVNG